MKIQVTEEDIKNGVRKHPQRCAVACAIKRVLKVYSGVDVRPGYRFTGVIKLFDVTGKKYEIEMSPEIERFAQAFDQGDPVGPCEFELPCNPIIKA